MKQGCKIINRHIHSPYFIFLEASGRLSDSELLKLLRLDGFMSCPVTFDWRQPHLYITHDNAWIHIADDWLYSLWHKGHQSLTDTIHKDIPDVSIFSCSVGDADRSFDFEYYCSGDLVRRLVVEGPKYDKNLRVVIENFGSPLAQEKAFPEIADELDYVLSLAAGVGVKINHEPDFIRCYSKSI